jgi:penicillin-binding protein 2
MPQYQPIFLKEDITPDELAFIEAHKNELPELETIMAHRRLYPRNGFMAHLIGYVGEVTEDMLNQPQFELYNPRRRGGRERSGEAVQQHSDGQERIAARDCE